MSNPKMPMDPAHEREQALFILAAAKPVTERAAFLDRECAGNAALRARLEALLAAHELPQPALDAPAALPKATVKLDYPSETTSVGKTIGRYKILERVGEGGCGVVYVAEQLEPLRRRVALKVIKLGMDTKQVVARFEAERQALAMMDHPNIAKVLDAGATETGRPYFVMELVRGIKFTDYCDQNKLSTHDRLNLFVQVCHAIQHAHQKGIIHRDIKPSNILVTLHDSVPVPKVIDFGIAKATEGKLTDATVYTQLHQFIGTPAYMSPEQAEMSGLDIDTRSDIYSLGVLLYELLTGKTPFDAQELVSLGIDAMRRTIREQEPVRPSTKLNTLNGDELTTTAKRRSVESSKLAKLLRGDLDWIVMKCLEKDRTRRYDNVSSLASDIKRHLQNEAVAARPPSATYRFQKLVRRHKLVFAAGAAVGISLIIGITVSLWQAVRANRILGELRAAAPTFAEQARALAAKGQFDEAIEKLDYAVKLQPQAPEYLAAKGDLLLCQLKINEALANYREALHVKPGFARAETAAKLCDEVLAAPHSEQSKFNLESLFKIHGVLQEQKRSPAELKLVKENYSEEKQRLWNYWQPRLQALPVFAGIKLEPTLPITAAKGGQPSLDSLRFDIRNDGQLGVSLQGLNVSDFSSLKGLPVADLYLNDCTNITDVTMLTDFPALENVTIPTGARNIEALRKLSKLKRLSFKLDGPPTPSAQQINAIASRLVLDKSGQLDAVETDKAIFRLAMFGIEGPWFHQTPTTTAEEFWKEYDAKKKAEGEK